MSRDVDATIDAFLNGTPHAVVGASQDRRKYGNKVLRTYLQHSRPVYAVNPNCDEVEGLMAYPTLAAVPGVIHGISIITPPHVTEVVVRQAISLGIHHIWMQPGAESARAVAAARDTGIDVIAGGPCILVVLGFRP